MTGGAKPDCGCKWIGGERFDLFFFFGSSLVAAAVGILIMAVPGLLIPILWGWLWLIDGPHLLATWQRTYFDPEERHKRRRLLLASLLLLLPGILAWGASKFSGSPIPFQLFLGAAALFAWHHTVRQHYGIMAVYEAYAGTPARLWRFAKVLTQAILWGAFLISLAMLPVNRRILGLPAGLPAGGRLAVGVAIAAVGLCLAAFIASIPLRVRRGFDPRPALFAIFPVFGLTGFMFFVMGFWEPLLPGASNGEQLVLGISVVGGMVHGLQYLGIVMAANRRRHGQSSSMDLAGRLGRRPWAAFAFLALLSLPYLALNAARGTMPALAWFPDGSDAAQLFLALYWGVFFHHYYLDQKIWKVRHDPRVRTELGIA